MPRSVPVFSRSSISLRCADGDAAVVGAHQNFARQIVHRAGDPFRQPAAVDEDQGGAVRPDQFQQLGMNGAPDGGTHRALRGGAAGNGLDLVELASCLRAGTSMRRSSRFGALASTMVTGR